MNKWVRRTYYNRASVKNKMKRKGALYITNLIEKN